MSQKQSTRNEGASKKAVAKKESHQFETMSQKQNRTGKGRQKNGSDGSSNSGRGSNH